MYGSKYPYTYTRWTKHNFKKPIITSTQCGCNVLVCVFFIFSGGLKVFSGFESRKPENQETLKNQGRPGPGKPGEKPGNNPESEQTNNAPNTQKTWKKYRKTWGKGPGKGIYIFIHIYIHIDLCLFIKPQQYEP